MKIPVVFGFVAIAVVFIASPVSAKKPSFDPNGVWYVVGQDRGSKLNLHCWDVVISTSDLEFDGNATSHYTDGSGETHVVQYRFHDSDLGTDHDRIIRVSRNNGHAFPSEVNFVVTVIDDNTILLFNLNYSKRFKFGYVYLSRNPSPDIEFQPSNPATVIDNSCATFNE